MLKDVIELQQNSGLHGVLNRHFGRIDTPEHALMAVRSIAKAFLWLTVVAAIAGLILARPTTIIDAIIWAGLGLWLLRRQSRVAACLLLVVAVIPLISWALFFVSHSFYPFGGGNIFIQIAITAMAWRAAYATFRYHGNWKGLQPDSPAQEMPVGRETGI